MLMKTQCHVTVTDVLWEREAGRRTASGDTGGGVGRKVALAWSLERDVRFGHAGEVINSNIIVSVLRSAPGFALHTTVSSVCTVPGGCTNTAPESTRRADWQGLPTC